ncbi:MAG: type II secretion system F family protein [Nocardioides sp.]|nr:type II secretion system F family protein [Nocardioides sp.]
MTMLLILGLLLVLLAIYLVSMASRTARHESASVARALAALEAMGGAPRELTAELDRPFKERVLDPLQRRALKLGRTFSGADSSERIRHKLDLAGSPVGWTVDRVVALKVVGLVVGPVIAAAVAFLVLDLSLTTRIVVVGAGAVLGFFAVNFYLYQKGYDRQKQLQKDLPDAIDLLTISVESGLAFDAAVQQVSRNTEGPLSDEFSRALREMQIGSGRSDALRGMADRTNLPEFRGFIGSLVQADAFGIPIAQVLRVQSSEMRVKRRQRAEQKAQQVPVKMTIPLIFCILPCLFIAVLGPAVINIMDNLG